MELSESADLMSDMEQNLDEIRRKHRIEENQLRDIVDGLRHSKARVVSLVEEVNDYIFSGKDKRVAKIATEIQALERQIQAKQSEIVQINDESNRLSKALSEIQVVERNIQDNLKFRRIKRDISDKENIIRELARKVGGYDAEAYRHQSAEYSRRQSDLTAEVCMPPIWSLFNHSISEQACKVKSSS